MLRPTRLAATTAAVLIPLAVATGSGAPPIPVAADLVADAPVAPAAVAPQPAVPSTTDLVLDHGGLVAEARPALAGTGAVDAQDIPLTALAAYQRATAVISEVQTDCGLRWELLAAIGSVESDHGRVGGATLNPDGTSSPAVLGPVLDGKGQLAAIADTDAGQYDGDVRWDRAVGPMQFLPSTWTMVAVDADGDGVRSADDLDDAALGAAVYLCSGAEDLGTTAGARAALLRYNHSAAYATRVLDVARAYAEGRAVTPARVSVEAITSTVAVTGAPAEHVRPVTSVFVPHHHPKPSRPVPDPAPADPGPFDPAPSDPAPSDPAPPDPTPEPTPDPAPTTLTGVLSVCADAADTWCLGDVVLDLGDEARLAAVASADLDGDGTVESNRDEISGLVGTDVTLGIAGDDTPARVVSVNGTAYADG